MPFVRCPFCNRIIHLLAEELDLTIECARCFQRFPVRDEPDEYEQELPHPPAMLLGWTLAGLTSLIALGLFLAAWVVHSGP